MLVAVGLLLRIPASPAGGAAAQPESPGQAAIALECPDGDQQLIAEAVYPDTPPETESGPREALRQFLRERFRTLLKVRFVAAARRAGRLQLDAQRDGRLIASALIARGPFGARAEGLTVCQSLLEGR